MEEECESAGNICIVQDYTPITDGSHFLRDLGISLHIRTLICPPGQNQPATEENGIHASRQSHRLRPVIAEEESGSEVHKPWYPEKNEASSFHSNNEKVK